MSDYREHLVALVLGIATGIPLTAAVFYGALAWWLPPAGDAVASTFTGLICGWAATMFWTLRLT